jgi:hypothetical protein
MSIYLGNFECKEDVQGSFCCGFLDNCHILLASYETGDYCGSAFVLFVENGKLYEVSASHCSCYGLENQWDPEETMLAALKHRIEKGNLNNQLEGYGQAILDEITALGLN